VNIIKVRDFVMVLMQGSHLQSCDYDTSYEKATANVKFFLIPRSVHYTHAAAEESYDCGRLRFLDFSSLYNFFPLACRPLAAGRVAKLSCC